MLYISLHIERIAVGDHYVGHFTCVERTQVFVYTEHLGRVECEGLERLVGRQSECFGVTGSVRQIAYPMSVVGREGDLDAALGHLRRQTIDGVIALPFFRL